MFIEVPTAKVIATFPEGYKYQMFEKKDGRIFICEFKGKEIIGYIYDGKEARKIVFKHDLED